MSWIDGLRYRLRVWLQPARFDREARAEQQFHIDMHARHLAQQQQQHPQQHPQHHPQQRAHDTHAHAYRLARVRFGNTTVYHEEARDMSGIGTFETFRQDIGYAWRSFMRAPGFTVIAVATLGIGIGANTAVYSALDALLVRPLPFERPDQLMKVSLTRSAVGDSPANPDAPWSWPKFRTFRAAAPTQSVFTAAGAFVDYESNVRIGDDGARMHTEVVSSEYFTVLGAVPHLGRTFVAEDDSASAPKSVILSHNTWINRFEARPDIIGTSISIDREPYVIVGVLQPGFDGITGRAEMWLPIVPAFPWAVDEAWSHMFQVVARRHDSVSVDRAIAASGLAGDVVHRTYPHPEGTPVVTGGTARSLDAIRVDPVVRRSAYVMAGAVALVLLIACVNIANLLLVRSSARVREMAVRLAIGAGRKRIIRQLLTESLLLAFMGGLVGAFVAFAGTQLLASLDPTRAFNVRRLDGVGAVSFDGITLDVRALAVAALLTISTGLLFGMAPAWRASRVSVNDQLKGVRRSGSSRLLFGRNVLVTIEIALAVVLLAGAGLMVRTLQNMLDVPLGFASENMLTFRLNSTGAVARDSASGFTTDIMQRIRTLPGVSAVTVQDCPPLNGGCNGTIVWRRDRPALPSGSEPSVGVHWIDPSWLDAMKVPLLRGRNFDSGDRAGRQKVVLVSETAARRIWPGEDALGKPVSVGQGGFSQDTAYVVGIVGDLRYVTVDSSPISDVYISHMQSPRTTQMFMVRTSGAPTAVLPSIRALLQEAAPGMPVYDMRTMDERVADSLGYPRFATLVLGAFAAVALALATMGAYGVIAFSVSQRTREIGIRMALGAQQRDVLHMVIRHGLLLAVLGACAGLVAAAGTTRVLQSLLYGITPQDLTTYASIAGVLIVSVVLASWIPARRASRVQPTVALREE